MRRRPQVSRLTVPDRGSRIKTVVKTCLLAWVIDASPGVKPIEWRLPGNRSLESVEEAARLIGCYRARREVKLCSDDLEFHRLGQGAQRQAELLIDAGEQRRLNRRRRVRVSVHPCHGHARTRGDQSERVKDRRRSDMVNVPTAPPVARRAVYRLPTAGCRRHRRARLRRESRRRMRRRASGDRARPFARRSSTP